MSADTERTFTARMKGVGAAELSLGGLDLLQLVKGVDIYLRAGQTPEVVVRPVLQEMFLDIESGDGKAPRYVVSPEVGVLLTEMGWASPEATRQSTAKYRELEDSLGDVSAEYQETHRQLQNALEHIKSLADKAQEAEALEEDRGRLAKELTALEGQHLTAVDRIKALEGERAEVAMSLETESQRVASLQEDLTTAHGRIQDLELANTTLQGELEAIQATQDRLQHPYDTTGR